MKNILVLLVVGILVAIGVYGANTGVKHDHTKDSWRSTNVDSSISVTKPNIEDNE